MAPDAVKEVQEYVKEVQEFVKEVQEHVKEVQEFEKIPHGRPGNAPTAAKHIQGAVRRHRSPLPTGYAGGVTRKATSPRTVRRRSSR